MNWIKNETLTNRLILAVSVVIPIAVASLRYTPQLDLSEATRSAIYKLPLINALLNASTFTLLIAALVAIRRGKIATHKTLTSLALIFSVLFLLSYVTFHATSTETPYGGEGPLRSLYYTVLISHILLSAVIVPLALLAYAHGFSGRYNRHKKIVKVAFPIWIYVTFTGVLVYIMISPYYPY